MNRLSFKTLSLWLAAVACLLSTPAGAVTIDMVTVGNPGNGTDPATGSIYGRVDYSYQIGKYEVTIGQYAEFLNAAAKTDPYSLYDTSMASDLNIAGISRAGSSGSYTYSVINNGGNSANRPITYVSWFDAARFANWMQNGQGSGSTETGAYTLVGGQTTGTAPEKKTGAQFYIPTENEWYKAAYYSPALNSGSGGYYTYATQSDAASPPGNTIGSGANQANYYANYYGGDYAVTQSSSYSSSQNYLTDVGAFSGSGSAYGTFDQTGNVFEWNDFTGVAGGSRGLRGGDWSNLADYWSTSSGNNNAPSSQYNYGIGFRLASPVASAVPEIDPNSLGSVLALVLGSLGLLERRRLKAA